ncbi:MAG: phosphoribosylformylglycinamidine synthase [Spirochaetaceae bacterium]|nr:phosphoribosylformylglycinamidine synthase [Spirochaetaceae bacterium]
MRETIQRVFVEKKNGFDGEARGLRADIAAFMGVRYPCLAELRSVRLLNRYDVGRLDGERFHRVVEMALSEPQSDTVYFCAEEPAEAGDRCFAVEYLPGQYDQRADSAEQCAELVTGIRPRVRTARVYILSPGEKALDAEALDAVKRYLINPVDSREAQRDLPRSLEEDAGAASGIPVLTGFLSLDGAGRAALRERFGLVMTDGDIAFCRDYFLSEGRDPTLTELRMLDTYWSDHCRHTTFTTGLSDIHIDGGEDGDAAALRRALAYYEKAREEVYGADAAVHERTLMDMATIGAKALKKRGLLGDLDESKEVNACTIKITVSFEDGSVEPWLLLFKNETHNHPSEIEPFGGAATCLGGAIRDPLSGRAFVFAAMRVSGAASPRARLEETLPGKLPQVKIAREAAAGYAGYGNQIGLATGQVAEVYHPGFLAKRLELGAVMGAVPQSWVRREEPAPGDAVILVGGATGRDGIGGATGSSKAHTGESVEMSGAEVQKGNAVEERKLQRLFRRRAAVALIKRCNDFGAGGVAVAVGELAGGLDIDLDAAPKKYAGLDGTEIALSESQERMAVVTAPDDAAAFIREAEKENLSAVIIARVTAPDGDPAARLRMFWQGKPIADLARRFLDTAGAKRSASARITPGPQASPNMAAAPTMASPNMAAQLLAIIERLKEELSGLRSGSRRGLQERFDGSIGASSVLFPFGGQTQGTSECGLAALIPSREKRTVTAGLFTFGYDPDLAARSPYRGAKGAIREALAKFACLGGDPFTARLSFQEYFARAESPESWGKPAAALLGALEAQLELGVPAIGGKDSMSGNYRDAERGVSLTVPPTLAAFAAGTARAACVRSGALSRSFPAGGPEGNPVVLLPQTGAREWDCFRRNMRTIADLSRRGWVRSAYPVGPGGAAVSLAIMAFGNMTGVEAYAASFSAVEDDFRQGSVLLELDGERAAGFHPEEYGAVLAARTVPEAVFRVIAGPGDTGNGTSPRAEIALAELRAAYESALAEVYPVTGYPVTGGGAFPMRRGDPPAAPVRATPREKTGAPRRGIARPLVILPVFPGTNCEWDMERVFREAGARTRLIVFRNRDAPGREESIRVLSRAISGAEIVALSGGFSAGDEPDGSGKFIANVFRSPALMDALMAFLERRDGLMLGICNGFQALIKLGLVPYGKIIAPQSGAPTLAANRVGRHVSRMVHTRIVSRLSPWFALEEEGAVHTLPVSHGEGRLVIREEEAEALFAAGQVAACYADSSGETARVEPDNPNGSDYAIEALSSPDGRIVGKMAHSERRGPFVHINIPGNLEQRIFEAGVRYFSSGSR